MGLKHFFLRPTGGSTQKGVPVLQDVAPKKRGRPASQELRRLLEQSQKELEELRAEVAGQAERGPPLRRRLACSAGRAGPRA